MVKEHSVGFQSKSISGDKSAEMNLGVSRNDDGAIRLARDTNGDGKITKDDGHVDISQDGKLAVLDGKGHVSYLNAGTDGQDMYKLAQGLLQDKGVKTDVTQIGTAAQLDSFAKASYRIGELPSQSTVGAKLADNSLKGGKGL